MFSESNPPSLESAVSQLVIYSKNCSTAMENSQETQKKAFYLASGKSANAKAIPTEMLISMGNAVKLPFQLLGMLTKYPLLGIAFAVSLKQGKLLEAIRSFPSLRTVGGTAYKVIVYTLAALLSGTVGWFSSRINYAAHKQLGLLSQELHKMKEEELAKENQEQLRLTNSALQSRVNTLTEGIEEVAHRIKKTIPPSTLKEELEIAERDNRKDKNPEDVIKEVEEYVEELGLLLTSSQTEEPPEESSAEEEVLIPNLSDEEEERLRTVPIVKPPEELENSFLENLEKAQEEISRLRSKETQAKLKISNLQSNLERVEKENETLKSTIEELKTKRQKPVPKESAPIQQQITQEEENVELTDLSNKNRKLSQRIESLENSLQNSKERIEALEEEVEAKDKILARKMNEQQIEELREKSQIMAEFFKQNQDAADAFALFLASRKVA